MSGVGDDGQAAGVPAGLQLATAWTWRLGVIGGVAYGMYLFVTFFAPLLFPFFVAVLLTALLAPLVNLQCKYRVPRSVAVATSMTCALAVFVGLMTVVGTGVAEGIQQLIGQSRDGLRKVTELIVAAPIDLPFADVDGAANRLYHMMGDSSESLARTALSVTGTAGQIATGFVLAIFCAIFLLHDGRGMWLWFLKLLPRQAQPATDGAAMAGWVTLTSFVRATIVVALVDAVGIGFGAALLGVPLVLPIMVLVFLGAFVPMIGAVVTGGIAVLVAFVAIGPWGAALMLLVVVVVQQLESHVLQPFLLGRAVSVHPVAVVLSIGAGLMLGGIMGALVAVPVVAVVNTMVMQMAGQVGPSVAGLGHEVVGEASGALAVAAQGSDPDDNADNAGSTDNAGKTTDETS